MHENTTGYLKNHWTKLKLVCIYLDVFNMMILNMAKRWNKSEFFDNEKLNL